MPVRILGISAFYHDSAAALLEDGRIIAAAQEERFSRIKHDAGFPAHAIRYCLDQAGVRLGEVDHIAFFEKPFLKFERLLQTYLAFAPRGFASFAVAMPVWVREKLFQKKLLHDELERLDPSYDRTRPLLFGEHHLSHAASAFYASPFDEALVLTMDGVGEWATTTAALGRGAELEILRELHFPHSLGLLYSAFTYYTGFKVNSGEYKLMGLAPYGTPRYREQIERELVDIKPDGSFRLNLDYFDYCTGLTMTNRRFAESFGGPPRREHEPLTQRHMDLAASIQAVTETIVLKLARALRESTGQRHLCLAGGVALNCVANGKLLRSGLFDELWIQPAAGDAGGSLGVAYTVWHQHLRQGRASPLRPDAMAGAYLGPAYGDDEAAARLAARGARFHRLDDTALYARAAQDLAAGLALGWMQGRMEFGPRALGARSILADARHPEMQKRLNLKIKFRESFRPFAPAVLAERVQDWFELDRPSPYMLLVADVRPEHRLSPSAPSAALGLERVNQVRSTVPAITHVDYSARIQTVHVETNPRLHALLSAFERLTGCPILVNTSFNVRGEPIVCTPEDAFRCFMGTHLDRLAIGNLYLVKEEQDPALASEYAQLLPKD